MAHKNKQRWRDTKLYERCKHVMKEDFSTYTEWNPLCECGELAIWQKGNVHTCHKCEMKGRR